MKNDGDADGDGNADAVAIDPTTAAARKDAADCCIAEIARFPAAAGADTAAEKAAAGDNGRADTDSVDRDFVDRDSAGTDCTAAVSVYFAALRR